MSEVKQKALDKMNEELSKPHSSTEDYIHNWLCDQEDDELFECILKEGKTINDSLSYLTKKAKEGSNGSRAAAMSDEDGFKIIVDYFKGNETKVKSYGVVSNNTVVEKTEPAVVVNTVTPLTKQKVKKEPKEESQLMSMFDFGVEVIDDKPKIEDVDEEDYEDDDNE